MSADKISITPDELVELEKLCDRSSLYDVLCALAVICHEKAEHIEQCGDTVPPNPHRSQYEGVADTWRKRGLQVQATAEYLERMEFDRDHTRLHREFTGRLKR